MDAVGQFRRRVLLVDSDEIFVNAASAALRGDGYEVISARDGFEALQALRGGMPDLLVVELDLPRMSGFELLSIARSRFPQLGAIAVSGAFSAASLPSATICDAFQPKGVNVAFELVQAVHELVAQLPLRASLLHRSALAPVWVPRTDTRYVVLTCPECMRSFPAAHRASESGLALTETCLSCGAEVAFVLSDTAGEPQPVRAGTAERAHALAVESRKATALSEDAIASSRRMINKRRRKPA